MDWIKLPPHELVLACAQPGSPAAWTEFMRRYHPVITAAALRVSRKWKCGSADEIADVIQDIYLHLCADNAKLLTSFKNQHPDAIFGYIKVASTNIAHDYYRHRAALKRGSGQTVAIDDLDPPGNTDSILQGLRLSEIERMLISLTTKENGARDRAIFRLYYHYGMTSQAIAELPGLGLSSKGVEGVLHRLTKAIREGLNQTQETGAD